jgi:CRP-like cAMP-binding protein
MITVQKALFLRKVPLFVGMPAREIGRVASIAEELVFAAGDAIIREGEYGDSMFVIVDGTVRIHRGDSDLSALSRNDYLGEMSILDGEPRSASATATSDCLVLRISQADFHEILASNFDAVLAIFRALSLRLRKREAEARKAD